MNPIPSVFELDRQKDFIGYARFWFGPDLWRAMHLLADQNQPLELHSGMTKGQPTREVLKRLENLSFRQLLVRDTKKRGGRWHYGPISEELANHFTQASRERANSRFYILSLKHTRADADYITVWRKENNGYAWPLSWAGQYTGREVYAELDYYHNGRDTLAIPCEALDAIAVPPKPGTVDNDAGPVVLQNAENWQRILVNCWQPCEPIYPPSPAFLRH